MRYRSHNYLLKIALILAVCVLLFCSWHITYGRRKSYLDTFSLNVRPSEFYAKVQLPRLRIRQNGEFWILENYVVARRQFGYLESMTYTTHGEYMFLDNLEELTKRWRAPISIAIFAPGLDFNRTIHSMNYLRSCTKLPPHIAGTNESYRQIHSILYPINVGRNIARRLATTHFILPSDIEMYPNLNIVEDFLNMIHRKPHLLFSERQVYPFAVFEVQQGQEIPNTKADLQEMIYLGQAVPFHKYVCMYCHAIPELERWVQQKESEPLDIFLIAKHRAGWEPFYVTTNLEPFFDERYSWEGQYDKQIQADLLAIMNYDFYILDNAFLVHRPGIKMPTQKNNLEIDKTKRRTWHEIKPQLQILYGNRTKI